MSQLLALLLIPVLTMALPDRSRCSSRDLTRQDCRLQAGEWNFQFSNKTVSWSDGVWKTVDNLPLSGEGLTWEKGQLKIMNKRVFVQLWIWDAGVGEGKVQSLHWYIFEFAQQKMSIVGQEVVRKRHPEIVEVKDAADKEPVSKVGVSRNTAKKVPVKTEPVEKEPQIKFVYDPMEVHQLVEAKGTKVKWSHLKKTTEF